MGRRLIDEDDNRYVFFSSSLFFTTNNYIYKYYVCDNVGTPPPHHLTQEPPRYHCKPSTGVTRMKRPKQLSSRLGPWYFFFSLLILQTSCIFIPFLGLYFEDEMGLSMGGKEREE